MTIMILCNIIIAARFSQPGKRAKPDSPLIHQQTDIHNAVQSIMEAPPVDAIKQLKAYIGLNQLFDEFMCIINGIMILSSHGFIHDCSNWIRSGIEIIM